MSALVREAGDARIIRADDRINSRIASEHQHPAEEGTEDLVRCTGAASIDAGMHEGGGIATQANLFHHNRLQRGDNASDLQTVVSPKTLSSATPLAN